jgi:hypothetical protein
MVVDAVACLVFAIMVFAAGVWLVKNWQPLGELVTQFMSREVLFGPEGEKLLVPLGVVMMGAGVYVAWQALLVITAR